MKNLFFALFLGIVACQTKPFRANAEVPAGVEKAAAAPCPLVWREISLKSGGKIKVFGNQPQGSVHTITIVIHGLKREPERYAKEFVEAVGARFDCEKDLVLAPWFRKQEKGTDEIRSEYLSWNERWKAGGLSHGKVPISAFQVVDELIGLYAASQSASAPKLARVNLIGHSAGGQFVQRYAFFSPLAPGVQGIPEGISFHYVSANPSSYMYLNHDRFDFIEGEFRPLSRAALEACPGYNRYKHGLTQIPPHLSAYVGDVAAALKRFRARAVLYALGENDNDPSHPDLARTCADQLQGHHRLERGQLYFRHLERVFPGPANHAHVLQLIPGISHRIGAVFGNAAIQDFLFPILPPGQK